MMQEKETTLYVKFLRHAQTNFNIGLETSIDETINKHGKEMASELKGHFSVVVCSPLKRCLDTLDHSNITYDKLIISSLCREHKKELCDFMCDEMIVPETEDECLARVQEFKRFLKREKPDLVISHADFIWLFSSKVLNGERFGKWVGNAEMIELEVFE